MLHDFWSLHVNRQYSNCGHGVCPGSRLDCFPRCSFNPARVWPGDPANPFLGFVLAALLMESSTNSSAVLAILVLTPSPSMRIMQAVLSIVRRLLDSLPSHLVKPTRTIQKSMRIATPDNEDIPHCLISHTASSTIRPYVLYIFSHVPLAWLDQPCPERQPTQLPHSHRSDGTEYQYSEGRNSKIWVFCATVSCFLYTSCP
jgi:hypothetical protein